MIYTVRSDCLLRYISNLWKLHLRYLLLTLLMRLGGGGAAVYCNYIFTVFIDIQSLNVEPWASCGMLGCKWGIVFLFFLQKQTAVKWAMGIFNLLDSLSKSFEKRATLGYSKSLSVSNSATATLTSQGQGMRTLRQKY